MLKTTYVCDSCHIESDKMLGITLNVGDSQSMKTARFHVCSEECIPTAVKMSLLVAKSEPQAEQGYAPMTAESGGLPSRLRSLVDKSSDTWYQGIGKKLKGK